MLILNYKYSLITGSLFPNDWAIKEIMVSYTSSHPRLKKNKIESEWRTYFFQGGTSCIHSIMIQPQWVSSAEDEVEKEN